jgi:hypothetical protein
MHTLIPLLITAALAADAPAGCPISTSLDPKVHVLTNKVFHKANPQHKDPAQVSGFTMTDFGSVSPWKVSGCGQGKYCVTPKDVKLVHHVYVRPRELAGGKPNPRWLSLDLFPCGEKPNANYVTYACTIEHEKVHVVQRDDALAAKCTEFVTKLAIVRESSAKAAEREAKALYTQLIKKISDADQETVPYEIEWKCNGDSAAKAGVACAKRPDFDKLGFLGGAKQSEGEKGGLKFEKDGAVAFTARFLDDATMLESTGAFEDCTKKKTWFFAGGRLDQENCAAADGMVTKTFYEFGRKQRVVRIDGKGAVVEQKLLFDPRERITAD